MNIAEILQQQAQARGTAPAIIDVRRGARRVTTYDQLERDAQHAAGMFRGLGLIPGDRVLVFVPMSAELYTLLSGIFRAGLVAMFLDPSAGRAHIERCCQMGQAKALVATPKAHLLRLISPSLWRIPRAIVVGGHLPATVPWSRLGHYPAVAGVCDAADDTPALITFTSGSTGAPKAAVRSHGFLLAQHRALASAIKLEAGQIDMGTLPIFTLANLASGLTTVIPAVDLRNPGRVDPGPVIEQVQRLGVTRVTASPAFFERIADYCLARQLVLATLTQIYTGGAPVFPRVLQKLRAIAPSADVVAVYGSTEAEPIAHVSWAQISPDDRAAMLSGAGLLAGAVEPSLQLRVIRRQWPAVIGALTQEQLRAETMPAGSAGEIIVNGPHVLRGYMNGVGDEQTKIRVAGDVWHRTGDAGYIDAGGRLWLLGRCEGCIEDWRGAVFPLALEVAATEMPGVHRAALVEHAGKRVLAVELEAGTANETLTRIQRTLTWAHLDKVILLAAIPVDKRHNAKVDYPALRALIARQLGG